MRGRGAASRRVTFSGMSRAESPRPESRASPRPLARSWLLACVLALAACASGPQADPLPSLSSAAPTQSGDPTASSTRPIPTESATGTATGLRTPYTPPGLFPSRMPSSTYAPLRRWSDVLQFTPFAYTTPLPPNVHTPVDGVYALFDPSEPQWWNCRRCPEYRPAGGVWRLQLDRGVMHLIYDVTGFGSVASYTVEGDRIALFNDPQCPYETGEYTWELEEGDLVLREVQDRCAIHLRAVNLTRQAWLSCQPPSARAAASDMWNKPPGCEGLG